MLNMVNVVLAADPNTNDLFTNFGEAFSYSISKALFGFAIVFGVLALIWAVLSLFKLFFYVIPNMKNTNTTAEKKEQKPDEKPVTEVSNVTVSAQNDYSIIAAITAAITAFRANIGEKSSFRVVSFKKRK